MSYDVIELRRYTIQSGERDHFAEYFDSYFPEAFQQVGAMALGQFVERDRPSAFTWLRGYRDMDTRAIALSQFYFGPVWKELKTIVNPLIVDYENVLLLRPLRPIPVLPAVDVIRERDLARGVVMMHILPHSDGLAHEVERAYARYRSAGLLLTLNEPNNFPRHPVRTDGPWLVWLGIFEDASQFAPIEGGEVVALAPTRRSRLRYLPS